MQIAIPTRSVGRILLPPLSASRGLENLVRNNTLRHRITLGFILCVCVNFAQSARSEVIPAGTL